MHSQETDKNLLTHTVAQAAISVVYPEFSFCSVEYIYREAIHNLTFTIGSSHAANTKLMHNIIYSFSILKTTFSPIITSSISTKIFVLLCLLLIVIPMKLHCEFKLLSLQLEK